MTWKYAVGTPSSFEQALDDVVRKLDDMQQPQLAPYEGKAGEPSKLVSRGQQTLQDNRPGVSVEEAESHAHKLADKASGLVASAAYGIHSQLHDTPSILAKAALSPDSKLKRTRALRHPRLDKERNPEARYPKAQSCPMPAVASEQPVPTKSRRQGPTKTVTTLPSDLAELQATRVKDIIAPPAVVKDNTFVNQDRDISDRDVLMGLKLAVTAACDENLDFWIRQKTGLRLRRFLADLKTFEDLEPPLSGAVITHMGDEKKGSPQMGQDGPHNEEEAGRLGDDEAENHGGGRRAGRRTKAARRRAEKERGLARGRRDAGA
jgi:hypothetical protein